MSKSKFRRYFIIKKSIEQLRQEREENEIKLQQAKHQMARLENRIKYYEKGDRQKRAHRLITRGAAIESIIPQVRQMDERPFYVLMEKVFSLPEVQAIVAAAVPDEGN